VRAGCGIAETDDCRTERTSKQQPMTVVNRARRWERKPAAAIIVSNLHTDRFIKSMIYLFSHDALSLTSYTVLICVNQHAANNTRHQTSASR